MQAAQGLRGRWAAGEDHSKLALESDDGKSAAREPPQRVSRANLPAGVVEAVFALPQGGVSEPLLVADEIHVYRVVERIPAGRKTFDQAKPEILRELKQRYVIPAPRRARELQRCCAFGREDGADRPDGAQGQRGGRRPDASRHNEAGQRVAGEMNPVHGGREPPA